MTTFLRACFAKSGDRRPTADQLLRSAWISKILPQEEDAEPATINELKKFNSGLASRRRDTPLLTVRKANKAESES